MRSSKTFSILFLDIHFTCNRQPSGNLCPGNRKRKKVNISLERKVDINLWDAKCQRAKGNTKTAQVLNQYLDEVYTQIFQCYQDFKYKRQLITAELIKARYCGEGEHAKTLLDIIRYHSKKIESTLTPGTVRNFKVTQSYVNKYLNDKLNTSDLYLHELNYKFISDFEDYLHDYWPKGHPKAMSHNTIMKHIQRLRKIVTLACSLTQSKTLPNSTIFHLYHQVR